VGDKLYKAKIIKTDSANDIAILKTEGQFVPLSIGAANQSRIGDDVFTIGFPAPLIQGFAPKPTKGSINAASGLQDDPRFFQISIPVQPGNSGGPLVDERGNVVGIVTSTLSPAIALSEGFIPQNVNYAIKARYAIALIDSVPDIRDKLVSPIAITTRTAVQLREDTQQGVGLVLVYTLPSDNVPNVRTSASVPARRRPEKSWDRPHI
jgi:S1-C subfamily serine protease